MQHRPASRYGRGALFVIVWACLATPPSRADEETESAASIWPPVSVQRHGTEPRGGAPETAGWLWPPVSEEQSEELFLADRPRRGMSLTARALAAPRTVVLGRRRLHVNISPFVGEVLAFFRRHGIPLQAHRDERGRGPVAVSAAFSVGKDLPAVSLQLGDRPLEPMGAFYSNERGLRWAVVWPVERFSLRIEGGEDSEFGYYGIAGLQWADPARGLAAGIGLPMNLRDAEGEVGIIFQFRMSLD